MSKKQSYAGGVLGSIEALVDYQWKSMLVASVCAVLIGILAVAHLGTTVLFVAVLFAIYLLASGIIEIANGFMIGLSTGYRILSVFTGILSIMLAIVGFRDLLDSVEMLGIWIGFSFFLGSLGVLSFPTLDSDLDSRGLQIMLGVLGLLFSIISFLFPISSVGALLWTMGIFLIIFGVFGIFVALRIRQETKDIAK